MAARPTLALAAALLALLLLQAEGRRFTRCGLVRELRRQGFPEYQMRDWVCLVENESGRDTSRRGPRNADGSYDSGLFQINSRYWCGLRRKAGVCDIECDAFLNDDISDDCRCAKIIHRSHGFYAWTAWKNKCNGRNLPNISRC